LTCGAPLEPNLCPFGIEIQFGSSPQLEDLPLAAVTVIRDANPHSCTPFHYHGSVVIIFHTTI
jgi:hypothetical protein